MRFGVAKQYIIPMARLKLLSILIFILIIDKQDLATSR